MYTLYMYNYAIIHCKIILHYIHLSIIMIFTECVTINSTSIHIYVHIISLVCTLMCVIVIIMFETLE